MGFFTVYMAIFTVHHMQRDTNFKHEKSRVWAGSFFLFLQIYDFYRWGKTGQIDFLEKPDPTNVKHFVTSLPSLMEFHRMERKKIHSQFCFLCPCWHKISKTTHAFPFKVHGLLRGTQSRFCAYVFGYQNGKIYMWHNKYFCFFSFHYTNALHTYLNLSQFT